MLAAPELEAVALLPVRAPGAGGFAVVHLLRGCGFDPLFGEQLRAVPFSFLKIELAKLGDVLGADEEAIPADAIALGGGVPARILDAERLKQAGLEKVERGLAGGFRHDGREQVTAGRVVTKVSAGRVRDWVREEVFHRWAGIERELRFHVMSAAHREQVAHAHGLEIVGGFHGRFGWEELQHRIVEAQLSLGGRESHRRGVEALAQRPHDMRLVCRLRLPPRLGDHVAVPHDHHTVQRLDLRVRRFDKSADRCRRNALRLGRTARQRQGCGDALTGREEQQCEDGAME